MSETEEIWRKRLERERAARKQAEALLERKSLELYESNRSLQASYDELEVRVAARTEELSQANVRLQEEIAERLRIEGSLRTSESQARTLALVASRTVNAVVITGANGKIEWVNSGFERITGYRGEEVIGRTPGSFLQGPETDRETVRYMKERIVRGEMFECDLLNYHKSGRTYWLHIEAQPLFDESGRLTHFMAIETDITERRESEQTLRESEERFRTLADSAPVLIWMTDARERFFYFNSTWQSFTGRQLDSEIDQGWYAGVHPDDRARVETEFCKAFRDRISIRTEFRLMHRDGEHRWILNTGVPRLTQDGRFEGYVGSAIDIHELKRKTAALAERITQAALETEIGYSVTQFGSLEAILERCANAISRHLGTALTRIWTVPADAPDDLAVLELKASVGDCSPPPQPEHRIAIGEFKIGKIARDRQSVLIQDIENHSKMIDKAWAHAEGLKTFFGFPLIVENRLVGVLVAFGRRAFPETIVEDLKSVADAISVGIERKNAEQALVKAKIDAEEASRSKSEFLANMSHEVRTPLGAILGYNELLTDSSVEGAQRVEIHERIRANGQHLLQILNDILDLSKIEAGRLFIEKLQFAPVDVVSETVANLRPRAEEKGVGISVVQTGPIPQRIISDPTRLRQILINLLGNAVKFTPAGKKIAVGIEVRPDEDMLVFYVEDEGIGITPAQRRKLFKPFEQGDSSTTRQFGGTGLGLSISKRLADMMGGVMDVTSEPGVGSRFSFLLPLSKIAVSKWSIQSIPVRKPTQESPSENLTRTSQGSALDLISGSRVLLCEDNPDNQRVIRFYLKKAGFTVDLAENGRIAIDKALSEKYDLVLMDMQMPELDGYATTRTLRKAGVDLPIVAVTANAMREDSEKCLDAGCDDYVPKPIDPDRLINTVQRLLMVRRGPLGTIR
ncbi:PAS domain S-box protein [bacterium]|nr:PAS domain S-box protein [bacterium]